MNHFPTLFQRPDRLRETLHVVTTVFNSARYRTRWKHYADFARMVGNHPGVELWTVEVAYGDREFAVTQPDNPHHLQLRTTTELWHKERSLNLLVQRLPHDWKKVAVVDADVFSVRPDWFDETKHALERFQVVQMWSQAHDLSNHYETINEHRSFADCYAANLPIGKAPKEYCGNGVIYWHPGYAWAWRREAWDTVGGLIDCSILGSADFHMAHALLGNIEATFQKGLHADYKKYLSEWQDRALLLQKNIGLVRGAIYHAWHGAKVTRRYKTRSEILESNKYHPRRDLVVDWQGLYKLSHKAPLALRDQVRTYFHEREEDSTCPYGH
jgi:hypothetical protein